MTEPFSLNTQDPRFDATRPVAVNGYLFVPVASLKLADLDPIIRLFAIMGELATDNFYDRLWNFRNQLVPFQSGDEHFDEECA